MRLSGRDGSLDQSLVTTSSGLIQVDLGREGLDQDKIRQRKYKQLELSTLGHHLGSKTF
jgi:ABC-type transport system involved in cytochrome c biogenesis ATPase subunit